MKFTLIYEGPLKPQNKADKQHKHDIRSQFKIQLQNLWNAQPLADWRDSCIGMENTDLVKSFESALNGTIASPDEGYLEVFGGEYFLPVVSAKTHSSAEICIRWFRNEESGKLLEVGDIDNRLKTILDALQVPPLTQMLAEKIGTTQTDPFCTALQDDALATAINIATVRDLRPDQGKTVLLAVDIKTIVSQQTWGIMVLQ